MASKIKIEFEVSEQLTSDIVVTAVEGGIDYWADVKKYRPEFHATAEIVEIETSDEGPGAQPRRARLDHELVVKGIEKILSARLLREDLQQTLAQAVATDDGSDIDSELADAIVQAGIFDDVIYG